MRSVSGSAAIADASDVRVGSGATFNLAAGETVGSIAGAGNVTLNANTLTAGGSNATTTYSGVMSGTGGLTKAGTGTLTLNGTNTYSGTTNVSAGTMSVNGSAAIAATSNQTAGTGATADLTAGETVGSNAGAG